METIKSETTPIICFGQQPSGFFPKRFLVAKILTARKLQKEIGGKIVFFYHDSDADYRETITIFHDRRTGAEVRLNFTQENKIQKKHSPLYLKRIPKDWKAETLKQLPRFVDEKLIAIFKSIKAGTVSEFCLKMYAALGLLDGIETVRSGDAAFREKTSEISADLYADIPYQGEIVRAKIESGLARLHEGGGKFTDLTPPAHLEKRQKNPGKDSRFKWMQSAIHCTHYIYGEGEKNYLKFEEFPEVKFIQREKIDRPGETWVPE